MIFPRLPNPTLVMYVFPHLAGDDQVPVPGYATAFPFYERVEYAQRILPCEAVREHHQHKPRDVAEASWFDFALLVKGELFSEE